MKLWQIIPSGGVFHNKQRIQAIMCVFHPGGGDYEEVYHSILDHFSFLTFYPVLSDARLCQCSDAAHRKVWSIVINCSFGELPLSSKQVITNWKHARVITNWILNHFEVTASAQHRGFASRVHFRRTENAGKHESSTPRLICMWLICM